MCGVVTALLASMDTSVDILDVIVVPPGPVVVLWVNPMALLVLLGKTAVKRRPGKPPSQHEPGEALILTLLGREEEENSVKDLLVFVSGANVLKIFLYVL